MRHSSPQGARQDDCIWAGIPLPWASPAVVNTILWRHSWESCVSHRTTGSSLSGAHESALSQQRGRAGQEKCYKQLHKNLCLNLAGFNHQTDLEPQPPGAASLGYPQAPKPVAGKERSCRPATADLVIKLSRDHARRGAGEGQSTGTIPACSMQAAQPGSGRVGGGEPSTTAGHGDCSHLLPQACTELHVCVQTRALTGVWGSRWFPLTSAGTGAEQCIWALPSARKADQLPKYSMIKHGSRHAPFLTRGMTSCEAE